MCKVASTMDKVLQFVLTLCRINHFRAESDQIVHYLKNDKGRVHSISLSRSLFLQQYHTLSKPVHNQIKLLHTFSNKKKINYLIFFFGQQDSISIDENQTVTKISLNK